MRGGFGVLSISASRRSVTTLNTSPIMIIMTLQAGKECQLSTVTGAYLGLTVTDLIKSGDRIPQARWSRGPVQRVK